MWVLFAAPFVDLGAWLLELGREEIEWSLIVVLGIAMTIDAIGRTCCLAAPIPQRFTICASVILQWIGLIGAAIIGHQSYEIGIRSVLTDPSAPLFAVVFQGLAALLFTDFLDQVAFAIRRPELRERADVLRSTLRQILAGTGSLAVIGVVIVFVAVIVTVCTCGAGYYASILLGAVTLIPIVAFILYVVVKMFFEYAVVISRLRVAVLEYANRA